MAIPERRIASLGELISATNDVCGVHPHELMWYRGQESNPNWKLRPKIRRGFLAEQEHSFSAMFLQEAPLRYPNAPSPYDLPRWLTIMQHYGLPTRLLDWTQSPLVAAYFALNNDNDGVIWGLYPFRLNQLEAGIDRVQTIRSEEIEPFVRGAFSAEDCPSQARAIYGETIDIRMLVQQSTFTIHGGIDSLEDHPKADEFLVRFVLDPDTHLEMGFELLHCGMTPAHLFPDLENLARTISDAPKSLGRFLRLPGEGP